MATTAPKAPDTPPLPNKTKLIVLIPALEVEHTQTVNMIQCDYCSLRFAKASQLGGHISRKHPGMSEVYRKKKERF